MRSRISLGILMLMSFGPATALAWGDGCKFHADRAGGVDAKGVEKVVIRAGAGDMKVVGRSNAVRIEARGTACGARQELVDQSQINVRREGNVVYVETALPQGDGSWKIAFNEYAYIDLGVALPSGIPVEAVDSSGDTVMEDLAALKFEDSSGDIELRRIAGLTEVQDSSGDIRIETAGSAKVTDSSGDVNVTEVKGDVDIPSDSSGDIKVVKVTGNVHVGEDSSGGIRVEDVQGSVKIDSDSSGDIYATRVGGDFTVTDDTSGDIDSSEITGKVTIPDDKKDRG